MIRIAADSFNRRQGEPKRTFRGRLAFLLLAQDLHDVAAAIAFYYRHLTRLKNGWPLHGGAFILIALCNE